MKNSIVLFVGFLCMTFCLNVTYSQKEIPSIAVLSIDNTEDGLSPNQLASLARIEVTKYGAFEVYDPYDIEYLFKKNEFDAAGCYGKICLIEAGKILGVDKVLSGSVESFEQHVVITLRQVDVASEKIEKAQVMEFLKIENQLFAMIEITVQKMYGLEVDENMLVKLTKPDDFESTINVDADVLNLSGPRMGVTFFTGTAAKVYRNPKDIGGYDALPLLSQFGYQFEIKYLNSGNVQALFEIIPVITGLDQGRIIPSITVLSGIRSNKTGFEFGFGPNIFMTQEAEGFIDQNGDFVLPTGDNLPPEGQEMVKRIDSRGDYTIGSGIVLAAGKTFRSGKLNVPVNVFYIPGKNTQRFGISFGFNINSKRK